MKKRRFLGFFCSVLVACTLGFFMSTPTIAFADDLEELEREVEQLQERVEETTKQYEKAQAHVEELEKAVADKQAEIDAIEAQLPSQREQAANAMRELYKMQKSSPGLMELILSADDFNQFLTLITYLDAIQAHNVDAVDLLIATEAELDIQKAELAQKQAEAEEEARKVEQALEEAKEARAEAQRRAEEEAARQAAAAAAALEAARAAAAAQATMVNASGDNVAVEAPAEGGGSVAPVEWNTSDRDSFIASWGARIDAYLAGSPLGGYGTTFAAAAWDYGIDPRFSAAISTIESSQGRHCFRPHNAWGWGQASWSSWEEAIYAHAAGLAAGYGYTLTPAGAERYCPGTGGVYYATFIAQMQMI